MIRLKPSPHDQSRGPSHMLQKDPGPWSDPFIPVASREPVEIMRVLEGRSHPGTICSVELGSKSYSGVEGGIRTPESFWDIGLAVLRLTRLGHLHFSTREGDLLFKTLVCPDGGRGSHRQVASDGGRSMGSIDAFIGGSRWRCRIHKEGVADPCFLLTYIIVIWTTGRDRGMA